MSRTKAKQTLSLEEYKSAMEGIYTTSVNQATLDEAPMAYKSLDDILGAIGDSVDIIEVLKPIYNLAGVSTDAARTEFKTPKKAIPSFLWCPWMNSDQSRFFLQKRLFCF